MITNFSPFFKQKYLGFVTFLFFLTRVPLLKNHFFHCDDIAGLASYPIFSKIIGYFAWYSSELIHYKLFPKTPSFVFENILSRSFSLFMAFCSLLVVLLIIKTLFKNDYLTLLMGVIISCSQMSIIYSIHSGPYGYSTFSIGLMMFYILKMRNYKTQSRSYYMLIFCLIICPYIDIFSIFITPLFVIIILTKYNNGKIRLDNSRTNLITSLGLVVSSFVVILFQIIPLQKTINRPLAFHWNKGIENQFVFSKSSSFDFILNPLDTICFYIKNFMLIFENNLSPLNGFKNNLQEEVAIIISIIFLPVLAFGSLKLKKINFKLLLFIILSILFFFSLVYLNVLVLSPTRHNLWLNIIFIVLIAATINKLKQNVLIIFIIVISLGTLSSYSSFFKEREAKISYEFLKKLELEYQIDYFIDYTINSKEWFTTSKNISKLFNDKNLRTYKENYKASDSSLVFCLTNHRPIDNLTDTSSISRLTNLKLVLLYNNIKKTVKNEKTLYKKYIFSKTEFGRSKFCSNGTNGLFIKLIRVDFKQNNSS